MIEIVFAVCSILHGAQCREERLTFMAETVTPHQCMLFGQHEMAKWQEGHPNWQITRWRCGSVRHDVAKT